MSASDCQTPEKMGVSQFRIERAVEGFYSVFKCGMKGVHQHCAEKHLHRYVAEFDFRYSTRVKLGMDDRARTDRAIKGIVGKRLTYRTTNRQVGA